jgi:hypothetical protein
MKIRSMLLSLSAVVLFTSVSIASTAVQQSRERLIRRLPVEQNEPIAITDIKVNDRSVSFDKRFSADDEWLRSLVFSVKNKSDKLILYAAIDLQFPRPADSQDRMALHYMAYGNGALQTRKPTSQETLVGISPGETVEIRLSVQQFVALRDFLTAIKYSSSIEKVDLRIGHVIFADDTMWYGEEFRRDSNDPTSWVPSRPPDTRPR